MSGWVHHRDGKLVKRTELRKMTYCDRVGVTYMLPFGRIRPRDKTLLVFPALRLGVRVVRRRGGSTSGRSATSSKCSRVADWRACPSRRSRCLPARARQAAGPLGAHPDHLAAVPVPFPSRIAGTTAAGRRRPTSRASRVRASADAFDDTRISRSSGARPGYVVIGDSMAGTGSTSGGSPS